MRTIIRIKSLWISIILILLDWPKDASDIISNVAGIEISNPRGIMRVNSAFSGTSSSDHCDGSLSFLTESTAGKFVHTQDSPAPFKFIFLRRNYLPEYPLKVTITAEYDSEFSSFFVQVQDPTTNKPVGFFNASYSDKDVELVKCEDIQDNNLNTAIPGTSFRERSAVTLYWNAPTNFNKSVVVRINAITSDRPGEGWRGLTSDEIIPKSDECIKPDGSAYDGSIAVTKSGIPCQRWSSQSPHTHVFTDQSESEGNLISNFCRRPKSKSTPWCFTTSQHVRYEECDIPKCTDIKNHFLEFGDSAGDSKVEKGTNGNVNFTSNFPMLHTGYKYAAIFEDGVIVLSKDYKTLESFQLWPNGSFTLTKESPITHITSGVLAPFWTNIHREKNITGQGYIYFRQSSEPDIILPLSDIITRNLQKKDQTELFTPNWSLIVTWHLVSDDAMVTEVDNLNTFQAVLTTDGNRSFILYNYDMKKWSSRENTALVGYKAGNGFRFLNHSLSFTEIEDFEIAMNLGRAVSSYSNVDTPGQMMHEVSLYKDELPGQRKDSLVMRLEAEDPASKQRSSSRGDSGSCFGVTCSQNGTCDTNTGGCVCDHGYTGTACDVNIDECASDPCQNGATCKDGENRYTCECRPGYTGKRCQDDINECSSSPCDNGGTCRDQENYYECNCLHNYTGRNCETLINQCSSDPCMHGGNCVEAGESYFCDCRPGYLGNRCQIQQCFDGICKNSQRCIDKTSGLVNCTCSNISVSQDEYCQKVLPTQPPPVCAMTTQRNDLFGDITWPESVNGSEAVALCPVPTTRNATRHCNAGTWEEADLSRCDTLNQAGVEILNLARGVISADNASSVASQILNITGNNTMELKAYDIANVADILLEVVEVSGEELDLTLTNDVFNSISNIIGASTDQVAQASEEYSSNSKFLQIIDKVLLKVRINEGEEYFESNNIKAGVSAIHNRQNFSGVSFSLSTGKPVITSGVDTEMTSASVVLPDSVVSSIPSTAEVNRVQFAMYTKTSLFQNTKMTSVSTESDMEPNYTLFSQYVLSASVGELKISNLTERITIVLPRTQVEYSGRGPFCVFYQFPKNGESDSWSEDGCRLRETTASNIICECDHLTNFAAIMDVYGNVGYFDKYQQKILQIITYIGCGLSIFGLLCTLISYTIFKKIRKEIPAKILICLCLALIAVNVVYLFMHSAYYSTPGKCVAVAAIMHYVLLCSLVWMGLEAVNMYIALVRVFNSYYRRYMLKMSIIGWGAPLLIVLIAFIVQFITGIPSYQMNNQTEICWLRREVFYGTLVAPFGIILIMNIVIYCMVLAQLLGITSRKLKHLDSARKMRRPSKKENFRKIRGAIGLMALLGISWGFALGTIDRAALVFSYVFVVFNSSQGFWVFIFHCVLKKEVSNSWKRLFCGKGKKFRDGSSRWSRFSSSNSRTSRTAASKSSRSMSTSSIRTSYMIPKTSQSVCTNEASIGLDSNGKDRVTRSCSQGFVNPAYSEPDPGDPPPHPPPPIPTEERVVRRVPRPSNQSLSITMATQTDPNYLSTSNSESEGDDAEEERRDSVDDVFISRGAILPMQRHRQVVISPSNESGIYSDTSVSSVAQQVRSTRIRRATRQERDDHLTRTENTVLTNRNNSISSEESPVTSQPSIPQLSNYGLKNESRTIDSGVSTASELTDSPRSQNGRPELAVQASRSSISSTNSNESGKSMPSRESESANTNANNSNTAPHMWRAPLVIKRSETAFSGQAPHMSPEGNTKRMLWKKHRNHAKTTDNTTKKQSSPDVSPKWRSTFTKSISVDENSPQKNPSQAARKTDSP